MSSLYLPKYSLRRLRRIQTMINQLHPETEPGALMVPGSPLPQGNIIVFPASFNPPTNAHLALLKQARRFIRMQDSQNWRLYAAFSKLTVDKEAVERPLLLDRVALLRLLLNRYLPRTGILLTNRGLYVEQAEGIRRSFPTVQRIFFLIGYDKIVQIFDPRYYHDRDASLSELFRLAELLVAPRGSSGPAALETLLQQPQNQCFARYVHPLPFSTAYRAVSSTQVRQALGTAHVPREVYRFMHDTRAYAPPRNQRNGTTIDDYAERVKRLRRLGIPLP